MSSTVEFSYHVRVWQASLIIFFRAKNLISMDHQRLDVYRVYINDDPGSTVAYLTARSNLVKVAYYAYASPRCLVSVYMTIGPPVFRFVFFGTHK